MYALVSAHKTLISGDKPSNFSQIDCTNYHKKTLVTIDTVPVSAARLSHGPLSGYDIIPAGKDGIRLFKEGKYLSAEKNGNVATDRSVPKEWETFFVVPLENVPKLRNHGSADAEMARFRSRVAQLNAEGAPVKIHVGAGKHPRAGFLNLDIKMNSVQFSVLHFDDFFIFPFVDMRWDLPENCVDYIYHEDFIEHIDQTDQFRFLAETLRVMKAGSWHRVNTPDLIWAIKSRSDFKLGSEGVYTGERQWGHIAMFSHASLAEVARIVGYKEVVFTSRHYGASPYRIEDFRPSADRDLILGNIFADLQKA